MEREKREKEMVRERQINRQRQKEERCEGDKKEFIEFKVNKRNVYILFLIYINTHNCTGCYVYTCMHI